MQISTTLIPSRECSLPDVDAVRQVDHLHADIGEQAEHQHPDADPVAEIVEPACQASSVRAILPSIWRRMWRSSRATPQPIIMIATVVTMCAAGRQTRVRCFFLLDGSETNRSVARDA